jgi:hypothetical protein
MTCRKMREALSRFGIQSVATRYTVSGCKGIDVAEIVVTGRQRMRCHRCKICYRRDEHCTSWRLVN